MNAQRLTELAFCIELLKLDNRYQSNPALLLAELNTEFKADFTMDELMELDQTLYEVEERKILFTHLNCDFDRTQY
jgi:hypothetical protein